MRSKDRKPVKKVHLTNFHIAGFGYWEGCEAFEQLKIGTQLDLVREDDNPFIPRGNNHDISKYLDMGFADIYDVRITRITPDVHPEQQVEVIVNIKNRG